MSSWTIRKPEPTHVRGFCVTCKKNLQKKTSRGKYQAICAACDHRRFNINTDKRKYIKYKLGVCNRCGFIPEHRCQMDVHHIDHNHHNNDPNNLETLCANCHRLEHRHKEAP